MSTVLLAVPTGGEGVKSGPIGLAIILVLCVACYFLFKSMSKHLRRVREEFPTEINDPLRPGTAPTPDPAAADPSVVHPKADAQPAVKADPGTAQELSVGVAREQGAGAGEDQTS